nr:hypothetical protein [Tanacetum cinerariifolium]GEZ97683.1 hypothetical protein [Tanacetum cinerariifolium]
MPLIITDTLKANLIGLLSEALKNALPQMIKEFIKQSVSESIKEKLPLFDAQVQQTLQDQLPSILLKPINKQFNAFNTMESHRFVTLQLELRKVIKTKVGVSVRYKITHRADQLTITKISYRVNSSKEATIRITRGNDPLNLTVYEKFRLKTLRFSEWIEAHALASKSTRGNDPLNLTMYEKFKLKTLSLVNGLKNLIPPPRVKGRKGLSIREPESGIFYYNSNFDLVFQREEEFHLAT